MSPSINVARMESTALYLNKLEWESRAAFGNNSDGCQSKIYVDNYTKAARLCLT